jgi:hypothetical protein
VTKPSLQQQVESWLIKTGFPLEMGTVEAFRAGLDPHEWEFMANQYYVDRESGQVREIDLQLSCVQFGPGGNTQLTVFSDFVIECKSTTSPWVVLANSVEKPARLPLADFVNARRFWRYHGPGGYLRDAGIKLTAIKPRLGREPEVVGYGVTEAFKASNSRDAAYSAMQQVVSAAHHVSAQFFDGWDDASPAIASICPIVVTSSPLFAAGIDRATGSLSTSPIDRASVFIPDRNSHPRLVHVVNYHALKNLVDDLAAHDAAVAALLPHIAPWPPEEVPKP